MFNKHNKSDVYRRILLPWVFFPLFVVILLGSNLLTFTVGKAYGENKLTDMIEQDIAHIKNQLPENQKESVETSVDFAPFWKAWYFLDKKFVDGKATSTTPITDEEKLWGAIQGLAASYGDPYTVFLPPEESKSFEEEIEGEFSGIGAEIAVRDGYLTVISPLEGSPASRAGLKPKDRILKIGDVDSRQMSADKAVTYIRGEKGTPVVLTIGRADSEQMEITIIRELIKVPTIKTETKGDVFVISLYTFTAKSPELFRDALQTFIDSGKKKLILDLRGNPGGFLDAAISISSWFLPEDAIVITERYQDERADKVHYSEGYNVFSDNLKFVILVDAGSASASEIVAGALRDHKKAVLVGESTFGKGSVQELFNITPETSLKVTIAKWLLPSGVHISNDGIVPDVVVDVPKDLSFEEDPIMDKALEVLADKDFSKKY